MHARRLEISAIIATAEHMSERIGDRFAGRGIAEREIQELTGVLSSKIWQKIMILDAFEASNPT